MVSLEKEGGVLGNTLKGELFFLGVPNIGDVGVVGLEILGGVPNINGGVGGNTVGGGVFEVLGEPNIGGGGAEKE